MPGSRLTWSGDVAAGRSAGRGTSTAAVAAAALVGAMFVSAIVVRQQTRRVQDEHPPLGRFVDVDGVRVHCIDAGDPTDDEAVALLHGNGTNALDFVYAGTIDAIAPLRRTIAIDRPGFGYSERPDDRRWTPEAQADLVAGVLDALGVRRAVLLGHSWGTLVAIAFGLQHPSRVAHLVLADGYYEPTPRLDALLLSPPAWPLIGPLLQHTLSPLAGLALWPLMMRKLFGPAGVPPSFRSYPRWMSLRPQQIEASASESGQMPAAAARLAPHYCELSMPVTLLAGSDDRMAITALHSERLHRALPDSRLIVVPGQGHMLQHLAPQVVEQALREAAGLVPHRVPTPRREIDRTETSDAAAG